MRGNRREVLRASWMCWQRIGPRFTLLGCWLALGVSFAGTTATTRSIDSVPQKATPTTQGGIALESASMPAQHSWQAALLLDANFAPLALKLGTDKLGDLIPFRLDAHLFFAYQLLPRLELAADLPVTLYQSDNFELLRAQGSNQPGISAVGLNEFRFLGRFALLQPERAPVGLAAIAELRLPTGDRTSFLGSRGVVFAPRAAVEKWFGKVGVLANLGFRFRYPGQFLNLYVGNELVMGVGAQVKLPDFKNFIQTRALAEMHLATPLEAPFTFRDSASLKSPWEVLVGLRTRVAPRIACELDLGRGVTTEPGYGREAFRVLAKVAYIFETDDRDGDGIPNDQDACPDEPEDRDGFQDSDGCPDADNDGDGVLDIHDACPNEPGSPEADGCPDRDGDQVPDNVDKCPDEFGPAQNDGCPSKEPPVVVESTRLKISGSVLFETAESKIKSQSFPMLNQVYDILKDHPELGRVSVEGHTDNRGAKAYNQDLSERRAKAVVDYFVKKGIPAARLASKGFGFERPVATNSTALGRAKNRRVEFNLMDEIGAAKANKANAPH